MRLLEIEREAIVAAVQVAERSRTRKRTCWWLLTGPPGSGKSALVHLFATQGWRAVEDPGRAEIEAGMRIGSSPAETRRDYLQFQHRVLERTLKAIEGIESSEAAVFDYGVAEALAFLKLRGYPWEDIFLKAAANLCFQKVFILDPIPAALIAIDPVRVEDDRARAGLRDLVEDVYLALGCDLTRVPVLSLAERYRYVLDRGLAPV